MSTAAQIEANRANAEKSTGPQTDAGKAASSNNNFRFGLAGNSFRVTNWEKQEEYDDVRNRFVCDLAPVTATERMLVESITKHYWLVQRAVLLQSRCLHPNTPKTFDPKQLALFLRYQTTHQRSFDKTLAQFQQLQADREKRTVPQSSSIGFESQSAAAAAQSRRESAEKRQNAAEIRREQLHEVRLQLTKARFSHYEAAISRRIAKLDHPKSPLTSVIDPARR